MGTGVASGFVSIDGGGAVFLVLLEYIGGAGFKLAFQGNTCVLESSTGVASRFVSTLQVAPVVAVGVASRFLLV